ncbi:MAG: hypothetical protein A3I24_03840 [Candidatus Harrisonbacteria bacterium RIFCSPLOWO2_02_FULL_41_13b]|uniref:Response regulatory domain-containing protein n=1 Tax=Candidatus Harrisonbacteria bacterium RIFCSPLOWO2_02_FULL_41_13b TaxID=1798409 RepID=A0A1G1ZPQ5_9BACT|nr:MAG: hypothetical protein A3I24_03840 [Candidatus Harrisonbacteria bacterium RIFCSPLOWO2_02_FULL_41_13b]
MAKTIFLIEDERSLVDALSKFLRDKGYAVESASNGKEALEKLPMIKPDFILLDIVLPEMSGIDFLGLVQKGENKEFANIPVMILTNLQGDEQQFKKLGLKVVGYLVKANTPLGFIADKIVEILGK